MCAVGYLTGSVDDFNRDRFSWLFRILGSGFLISDDTVMTCRHVIENRNDEKGIPIPAASKGVMFLDLNQVKPVFLQINQSRIVPKPGYPGFADWDVGFLQIDPSQFAASHQFAAVKTSPASHLAIRRRVGSLGYLLGNDLLSREPDEDGIFNTPQNWRLGPILLQGCLSAVVPHDAFPPSQYEDLLLQMTSERYMSGAPVFDPETGDLIGMVRANVEFDKSIEGVTTFQDLQRGPSIAFKKIMHPLEIARAVPVTDQNVTAWQQTSTVVI